MHPATPSGRDNAVGYGMLNPIAALTATLPSESGVPDEKATNVRMTMPDPNDKDWRPIQIALIGSGAGVAALLITLFVVHTVRRNRRDEATEDS